ncbi:MAG: CBS domain-containing protein [Flavobacteriales bacterium]|jgi:CBS domain-containing protein
MLTSFETDDYMSINPVCFSVDTDIFEAIHVLLQRKVSGGTVLNEGKEVIGVISELDCLRAIMNVGFYHEGGGCVGDFMTKGDIEYMDLHTSLIDAAQVLLDKKRRRMPIIQNGKFVGQISARSLLQVFKDTMQKHDSSED